MAPRKWRRIVVLLICVVFSALFSLKFRSLHGGTTTLDFGELYYGVRCAIHHHDPYQPDAVLSNFRAEGGRFPSDIVGATVAPIVIGINVYPPTSMFLVSPLALLPYAAAQWIWMLLGIVLLTIAGYLIWSAGSDAGPVLCGCLAGMVLANCEQMFMAGNVAGVGVSLAVIATWCFLKDRYSALGVILLAVSLAIKPHDVGFLWMFFLLTPGVMRKRALQTLAVTAVIGIAAALWIAPVSPHWLHELSHNNAIVSQPGGTSDPAMAGLTSGSVVSILDLQATLSLFLSDARAYNLLSVLIVGPLLVAWAWVVMRRRLTADGRWLALAAIAVLTLLPVYHRPYDAKLLLLTIPACALLWKQGGGRRWLSFGLTTGAIVLTSDLPRALIVSLTTKPHAASLPPDKTVAISLFPPPVLFATGCFYLWVLIRDSSAEPAAVEAGCEDELLELSTAS